MFDYWRKYINDKQPIIEKAPKEQWIFVRNIGSIVLSLAGLDILNPKFKLYWLSYLPGFAIVEFTSLLLYTLYLYRADLWRAIQPVCIIGILVTVSFQFIFTFKQFIYYAIRCRVPSATC